MSTKFEQTPASPPQSNEGEAARASREALAAAMRGWKPFKIISKNDGQEIGRGSILFCPGCGGQGETECQDCGAPLEPPVGKLRPDGAFARKMIVAHARQSLMQAGHEEAERLRRDGLAVTPENLKASLMVAVVDARPRSLLVPWITDDGIIEKLIAVVVRDFCDSAIAAMKRAPRRRFWRGEAGRGGDGRS